MEVVRIDTIDNFIGYIVDQIPIKFTFNAQLPIYYYKSRGLYTAEYPYWLTVPPSPAHEYLLLLHPSYVGQENMLGNIIIRTAAINETVELFDKEYRCIRYEVINDRGEVYAEIWITPGVGIVKVMAADKLDDLLLKLKNI